MPRGRAPLPGETFSCPAMATSLEKIAATQIMSPGLSPMPHMMRACAFAIARQSLRPIAKAVGRPVVPLVPWM